MRLDAQFNKDPLPGDTKFLDIAVSLGAGCNLNRFAIDLRWNDGLINIEGEQ